tara:strand:- start:314 stop:964 length:651 start_codon:yes stop_codon:yes gene_type:complete
VSKELKIKGALSRDRQQIYIGDEPTNIFIDESGHISSANIKSEEGNLTLTSTDLFLQNGTGNSFTPSHNDHIANKKYVDDNAGGGGTSYHHQMHQWYNTGTSNYYIPFGASTVEHSSTSNSLIDDTFWVAPFAGKLIKGYLYTDNACGATDIKIRKNGSLGSSVLSGGAVTVSATTVATFTCDQNNTFDAGDVLMIEFDITAKTDQATFSTVWELD